MTHLRRKIFFAKIEQTRQIANGTFASFIFYLCLIKLLFLVEIAIIIVQMRMGRIKRIFTIFRVSFAETMREPFPFSILFFAIGILRTYNPVSLNFYETHSSLSIAVHTSRGRHFIVRVCMYRLIAIEVRNDCDRFDGNRSIIQRQHGFKPTVLFDDDQFALLARNSLSAIPQKPTSL